MPKILVVDDNSDILLLLRVTFEGAGHDVVSTSDPHEAVPLAEAHAPSAIVLDVMMPGMSGWDVLEEIRRHPDMQTLPVLLLSALSDVNDRVRGLRGGADDYQVKPFEPEEILARVEGLIARRTRGLTACVPAAQGSAEGSELERTITELERRIASKQDLEDLRLGRYEVRKLVGRGAMGTVLRGWDPKLERPVALKTIRFSPEALDGSDRQRQASRLLREAVANARVNHPNIVTVYDVGDEGNAAFIAMELIEGPSLENRLAEFGKLPYQQVIPLAAVVARALAAAHGHEIIHRDIKPANVLLGGADRIKITDFGISEFLSRTSATGAVVGTPGYLAPEALTGSAVSRASDLFSLGVTIYECLTGRNPFAEQNWRKTLQNTVSKRPRPLEELVPEVPAPAAEMVSRLLEKESSARPPDATRVAELFEDLSSSEDLTWKSEVAAQPRRRYGVRTNRTRLVTLETLSKTLNLSGAPA